MRKSNPPTEVGGFLPVEKSVILNEVKDLKGA